MARTLMGLSAVKELNDTLRATVETQRALADKVRHLKCLSRVRNQKSFVRVSYLTVSSSLSQVEAMKEVGVFFSGLVRQLAGLREEAVQGLSSLQAEHDKLEDEIRRAQDRHQTVRHDAD